MNKPRAVVVDVDGTITIYSADRATRARDSQPRREVIEVVYALYASSYAIVFVTARPEAQRAATGEWIAQHVFRAAFDGALLLMKDTGDDEPDVAWKRRIYDEVIEPRYDVQLAIDDMERSVSVWRSRNVTVLQVRAAHVHPEALVRWRDAEHATVLEGGK